MANKNFEKNPNDCYVPRIQLNNAHTSALLGNQF